MEMAFYSSVPECTQEGENMASFESKRDQSSAKAAGAAGRGSGASFFWRVN